MDGIPNGRMACELSNWSGKAYKIPRGALKDCVDIPELNGTGVYLLFGKTEESSKKDIAYIGEAENIFKRLIQHLKEKDFWQDALVFVSKDDNLNKAHIKYMEHKMYTIALEADRHIILNKSIPNRPSISEPDMAEMDEFLDNTKMIAPILGFKIFEGLRNIDQDNQPMFFIKAARGADAIGQPTHDGFLVLQNSRVASDCVKSFSPSLNNFRTKLIDQEILKQKITGQKENQYILEEDYLFSSPSAAAAVVMGRNANGLKEWKTKEGKSLKEIESG